MNLYEDLMWRGLIKDIAGENLKEVLNGKPFTFYWGTDPTADSLHIGHYSSLITVKRLMKAGHHPLILCGGSTGRIGDPKPNAEREILSYDVISKNIKGIRKQIDKIFEGKAELVDNYDWTKDYTLLEFLRDIGKYINVNYMINKDIIAKRLETGITYAEFSYMLLQGYDFLYLYETKNCIMQVEGSDQWGNITTGIELIKKKLGKDAYAFTIPLILDATGKKFGKSEGNAIWLDKDKTTPYQMYQYLINSPDSKVLEYLKVFTFLSKEEIEEIMIKQNQNPESRIAQKTLAYEVVKDIHGKEESLKVKEISEKVFSEGTSENMPTIEIKEKEINILDLLIKANVSTSKSESKRLIIQGGIKINKQKIENIDLIVKINDGIVLQKGKKTFIKVINS